MAKRFTAGTARATARDLLVGVAAAGMLLGTAAVTSDAAAKNDAGSVPVQQSSQQR